MVSTPVQSTYSETIEPGRPGLIHGTDYETTTRICETADGIAFGMPVSQGAADKGVVLAGQSEDFIGVSVRDITLVHHDADDTDKYIETENMGVLRRGHIWLTASVAVAADDPVRYNATTGAWTNTGGELVQGARWERSAAAGEVTIAYFSGFQKMAAS